MKGSRWVVVAAFVAGGLALVAPAVGQGKAGHASLHWSVPLGGANVWDYAFGASPSGTPVSNRFKLSNWSKTPSGKLKVRLTGSAAFSLATDKCSKKSIGRNLSCGVTVTYKPGIAGTTDTTTLTATGAGKAATSLNLSGSSCSNAVAPGHIRCWGAGVNAPLPANARPGDADVRVPSVSCSSAGNCSAVGFYTDNASHYEGLLLTETGGVWSTGLAAPLPANAWAAGPVSVVESVSCSSAGNCGAVGRYLDTSGHWQGLLLTETAGVWSTGVEADLPANSNGVDSLTSISCSSPGNCSAVGLYQDTSVPWPNSPHRGLLLTETAGSWAPGVEVALPAGAYGLWEFGSVSCGAAGDCSAVGTYLVSYAGPTKPLLVTETGGSWGPGVDPPLPADAGSGVTELSSVSCASAGNCTAVGVYNGHSYAYGCDKYDCSYALEAEGLLLTETAGTWHADTAALPSPAVAVESLNAVSCSSPGNCSTLGRYLVDESTVEEEALALTETNGHWAAGVKVGFAYGSDYPSSISCVSPGNCGAVTGNGNVLVQTDGTWSTGSRPSRPVQDSWNGFASVSCTSDGGCTAVGLAQTRHGIVGLLTG
jgi:hypothetical protein